MKSLDCRRETGRICHSIADFDKRLLCCEVRPQIPPPAASSREVSVMVCQVGFLFPKFHRADSALRSQAAGFFGAAWCLKSATARFGCKQRKARDDIGAALGACAFSMLTHAPHTQTPRPACFSVPVCLYFCNAVSPDAWVFVRMLLHL